MSFCYILVNKRSDTKICFKYICMLKPKQLFIILYVNVCVKRAYPHKTINNILFRYGIIAESKFFVPWSSLRWSKQAYKSPAVINCAVNKSKQFAILKIYILTRTLIPRLSQHNRQRAVGMVQAGILTRPLQTTLMCLE